MDIGFGVSLAYDPEEAGGTRAGQYIAGVLDRGTAQVWDLSGKKVQTVWTSAKGLATKVRLHWLPRKVPTIVRCQAWHHSDGVLIIIRKVNYLS